MPYASGGDPMVGDRVSDKKSRIGTVTTVRLDPLDNPELTIKWDDGVTGIHYVFVEDFTLVARESERT